MLPRRRRTEIAMFLESFLASITFSIETISPNRREPIFLAEDDDGMVVGTASPRIARIQIDYKI